MIQQGCQHASSPYQPVFGLLQDGGFLNPLHPSFNRQAQRIQKVPENTKNPVYQKGSLPASDKFRSRLQHPLHSCHKIPCLDPQTILPFFDPSPNRT